MTPELFCESIRGKIKKEWIICVASVFLFGIIAHGYRLLNNLPNWDAMLNKYDTQNTIYLGRWLLSAACGISSFYELPWLNGLLSLTYISVIAILVSGLLGFRRNISIILMSGILAVFPSVTSTFCYLYTADGYFLGCLLMVLAVYFIFRWKKGWIPAVFLIAAGSGIYQAYITMAVTLVLLIGIRQLLFENKKLSETMVFFGKSLLAGVAGSALYYIILTVLLNLEGTVLEGYQNIEKAYRLENLNIPHALLKSVLYFFKFFIGDGSKVNLYVILNLIMICLLCVFIVRKILCGRIYRDRARLFLLLVIHGIFPAGCFALFLISPYLDYHMLMRYGCCCVYLYFLMFYEQSGLSAKAAAWSRWAILVCSGFILYNFILIANISYQVLEFSYEKSYSMVVRMADRLEQTEGWETAKSLAVLGRQAGTEAYSVNFPPEITGITYGTAARENFNVQAMLEDYAGIEKERISETKEEEILASADYCEMQNWPERGSVKLIGDTMVVKLGESENENEN